MMSFKNQLLRIADETENRMHELLCENPSDGAEKLNKAIKYSALGGGKRLRAYMANEFCELCGCDRKNALDFGVALEMIHAFSLIHDDLPAMDNDDMRRGKPSNHKAFGEATAILAGDSLALDAFSVIGKNSFCSPAQNLEAAILLSELSGRRGMCGGQQVDIDSEGKKIDIETLNKLVDLKTGALFACGCKLGCIAANASEEQKKAAFDFGILCGKAFQITDDLLDIYSTSEELGKSIGKDIDQEKSTFISILGEEGAKTLAESCIAKAKEILSVFPDNEAKNRLCEFCEYILIRKK